ncbi:hypothetical protein OIU78_004778 [Salix suchowensis]|nr:hypothetical protein OIU78_004778 [Salix suchowensis]
MSGGNLSKLLAGGSLMVQIFGSSCSGVSGKDEMSSEKVDLLLVSDKQNGLSTSPVLTSSFWPFGLSRSQDDRETWGFLKVMFEEDGTARTRMLAHLGFSIPVEEKDVVPEDNLTKEINSIRLNDTPADEMGYENNQEATIFSADDGEDFFNNLPSPKADTSLVPSGDNLEYGAKKGDGLRFFPPADRQTQEMHFQTMMQDIAASLLMEFEKYVFQAEYSGTISQDTFGFAS